MSDKSTNIIAIKFLRQTILELNSQPVSHMQCPNVPYLSVCLSVNLSKSQDYWDISAGAQQGHLTVSW